MRARNIKPGFWKNEQLASCDPVARLLFIGLWGIADREGRLKDSPLKIKMELFPCDPVDVAAMLIQLASAKLIERYEVNGDAFIQVTNFTKHQYPHAKERSSTIPAPNQHQPSIALEPEKNSASAGQASSQHQTSTNLGPNSVIQDSGFRIQGKEEGSGEKPNDISASSLALLWRFHRPAHSEHDRKAFDYFADLLSAGVDEKAIEDGIKQCPKSVAIWDFCKGLDPRIQNGKRERVGSARVAVPAGVAPRAKNRRVGSADDLSDSNAAASSESSP